MTLNFAELLCTENKEQPSQQLKQGSSDSPVQLSLHKVLICGYSNNFLIVCCHWDRQGIDTFHSLAVITQQCRNSAEHVKGNQPLAQLNSGKQPQIWGGKPNPYFSKEKLSTNRICKYMVKRLSFTYTSHTQHWSCRCGCNSPWQGTAASVNTSHRKKMSPFWRVEHKVKSTSVEDRDIMAEGKQGRL